MPPTPDEAAVTAVQACLDGSGAPWRVLGPGEWGLRAEAGGWALDIGLALRDGLLRAQAPVLGPGGAGDHELLYRNRRLTLVRLAHTGDGSIWLAGEIPEVAARHARDVDRLLGALVAAADDVRTAASRAQAPQRRRA